MNDQEFAKALSDASEYGAEEGRGAASWYFDAGRNNVTREQYQRVLKGIDDGDPEILDTLPHADLSGQWADGLTTESILRSVGWNDESVTAEQQDEIVGAFQTSYADAASDAIVNECHQMLEQDITFTLSVRTELDPEPLLSKLFDLLASENCDMLSDEFEID